MNLLVRYKNIIEGSRREVNLSNNLGGLGSNMMKVGIDSHTIWYRLVTKKARYIVKSLMVIEQSKQEQQIIHSYNYDSKWKIKTTNKPQNKIQISRQQNNLSFCLKWKRKEEINLLNSWVVWHAFILPMISPSNGKNY
jgi:hypothetical protein